MFAVPPAWVVEKFHAAKIPVANMVRRWLYSMRQTWNVLTSLNIRLEPQSIARRHSRLVLWLAYIRPMLTDHV